VLAGLAGCDGDEAPSPPPLEPSTTAASPSEPTGSPPPTRPPESEGSSVRSAKAFAHYFIDAVNYASRTGDTSLVEEASSPHCITCNAIVRNVNRIYSAGGSIEGKGMALDVITVAAKVPQMTFVLGMSYSAETVKRPGKADVHRKASKGSLTMYLGRAGNDHWRVDRLVIVQ
jgi:hypothetical protein